MNKKLNIIENYYLYIKVFDFSYAHNFDIVCQKLNYKGL